jgi:putative salt-induced outer membrane protein YdiY
MDRREAKYFRRGVQRVAIAFLALAATPAWAVVDIAPEEVGTDPGLSGNVAVSYSTQSGNTEKDEGDVSGKIKYDSNRRYLAFIQGTFEKSKSSGMLTEDELLTHARYLYKLGGETVYAEAFLQFYENTFQGIDNRWLTGANLRWRYFSNPKLGKLYLGGGAFREQLNYTDEYPNEDDSKMRLNSYLAYAVQLTEKTEFSMTGYYQPSVDETADYLAAFDAELSVHVVSDLYLSLTFEIDRDSQPPAGIEKLDQEISTSLIWKF